jgi:DNA-binding PadR family transcriptional regulator
MLKKLVSLGYIKADTQKRLETSQRVYHITPAGKKVVEEAKKNFGEMGQKWSAMRRIFIELLDPQGLEKFFIDGTKLQCDIARETLESKIHLISPSEAEYILKQYALSIQRQLDWANEMLEKSKRSAPMAVTSQNTRSKSA